MSEEVRLVLKEARAMIAEKGVCRPPHVPNETCAVIAIIDAGRALAAHEHGRRSVIGDAADVLADAIGISITRIADWNNTCGSKDEVLAGFDKAIASLDEA